jgi:hypothetical protein
VTSELTKHKKGHQFMGDLYLHGFQARLVQHFH